MAHARPPMSDIFISYAREDKQHAAMLASAFRAERWSVWWDETLRAGTAFDDVIEREVAAARCVVVLWSSHSIASRWVRAEVEDAANRGILVPVLIEAVVPPLSFRQIQAIDLSGSRTSDTSASLQRLIADVGIVLSDDRIRPAPGQNRRARLAAQLEKASLQFAPVVLGAIAVLQLYSPFAVALVASFFALTDGFIATQRRDLSKWFLLFSAAGEGVIAVVAATPGGYELIQRHYQYVIVFVLFRVAIASDALRQARWNAPQ